MLKRTACSIVALCALCLSYGAQAEDDYYYIAIADLKLTRGELPDPPAGAEQRTTSWRRMQNLSDFMHPRVAPAEKTEAHLNIIGNAWNPRLTRDYREYLANTFLAVRAPAGQIPKGRLFLPKPDWSGMLYVDYEIPAPTHEKGRGRQPFLEAKEAHYNRLLRLEGPGAAWYRHQRDEAQFELRGIEVEPGAQPRRPRPPRGSDLQRSYALFSGGRAISENLQLDRELRAVQPAEETVPLESIDGITIAEIDWKEAIAGKNPQKDPLASAIPEDQHAIFFPSFKAMMDLMDEAKAQGTPILRALERRSEDAQTAERYERQLCLTVDSLSRILGPRLVSSAAFTGSDPYLRTGSDVAVLFEAVDVKALQMVMVARHAAAAATPGAKTVSGNLHGVPYTGVLTPGRGVCSYLAAPGGKVVVVSNSLYQLDRIVRTVKGQVTPIAALDEYAFFRDRYPRTDADETALLLLTDATIRRWCGPRWRIAASRRTRAAAALAELQSRHLDELAQGQVTPRPLELSQPVQGAGQIQLTASGVHSTAYGTLEFLTPVAELPLTMVTEEEKRAYEDFRRNYQRQWRQFFDPIGVRFSVQPGRLEGDMTVRPLIGASDYREMMEISGNKQLAPDAGDVHPEALLHYVMALDPQSRPVRQFTNMGLRLVPGVSDTNALNWLGEYLAVYVDEDPFWQELEKAAADGEWRSVEQFFERNFIRTPIALHVDVSNGLKLTGFLAGLRAFIEQSAPGMLMWEALQYKEQHYTRISPSIPLRAQLRSSQNNDVWTSAALYYVATPQSLIFTLSEPMLKRALDRQAVRLKALAEGEKLPPPKRPWIGKSLGVQAMPAAMNIIQALYQDNLNIALERRSWLNVTILNEWRRRYGAPQPENFHQRYWQTRLVCPGGGKYAWNEEFQTMESSVYSHPGQPSKLWKSPAALLDFSAVDFGMTFEGDGLRVRAKLQRPPAFSK